MIIDLHCHTKMSDGSTGINELIKLAKMKGVNVLSITDHDTFAGSNRGVIIGKRCGVEVVPGVEISAYDYSRNKKVHMLCYSPINQDRLIRLLKHTSDLRKSAMSVTIQKVLRVYPMPLEMITERANGSTNIFKQHIMHALMDAGYAETLFGDVFLKLFHPKFGLAQKAWQYPDVYDVINEIREAGGIAVLAHPGEYDSMALMEELCEKDLIDGIELNHPRHTDDAKEQIRACCDKYQKFATGGTDFHGYYSQKPMLLGTCRTDESHLSILKRRRSLAG